MRTKGTGMAAMLVAAGLCGTGMAQDTSASAAQDKIFLMKASEGSMSEIQASQMALKKSKNQEIKSLAQKIIDDHQKLISDMQPFASQMGAQPPTKLSPKHQQEAERLRSMSGNQFDKEYLTAMVGDHHKDLGDFQSEEVSTSNSALKSTVQQGEQVIRQHTEMIDQLAQKQGIATPPMPASSPAAM